MKDTNSEKKRGRIRKLIIVVVVGGVAAVLVRYLLIGAFALFLYVISPQEVIYEMTEEEMELLIEEDPDDEKLIREGKLYDRQARRLEEMRYGMSYLQEKYPGYEFRINYIDGWAGTFNEYSIQEESSGEYFKMYMYENEDGSFYAEDNFYAYFLEEKYDAYLEELFRGMGAEIIKVDSDMPHVMDKKYDINMTVEDIRSRRLPLLTMVDISMSGEGMTEEKCIEEAKKLQEIIEEIDLAEVVVFNIEFWDMSVTEMEIAETYENYICTCMVSEEEEKWLMKVVY